jgi:glycosyltransferase involved in cell wall biosynthesis
MRILLVSHAPLTAELGAAQTALLLAGALRARGHDAFAWSPEPLPRGTHWWNVWRRQAQSIERFAESNSRFDVIDTPAISAGHRLLPYGQLVVRSIQPELRYLLFELQTDLLGRPSPRSFAHAVFGVWRAADILAGWRRASRILCLGTAEIEWMRRRFPRWAPKLRSYISAPSPADRIALLEVRRQRRTEPEAEGLRFLWIGRWAEHKGIRRLVSWIAERAVTAPHDTFTLAGCGLAAERDLPPAWLRSGRVRLFPSFSRTELPPLLASHDAGVFTSAIEGWGLSLNEMLESGLPVFATETGGVADLRPFFPESLRPFPPPARAGIEPARLEDLEANGYFQRFSWPEIARRYEEATLAACHIRP